MTDDNVEKMKELLMVACDRLSEQEYSKFLNTPAAIIHAGLADEDTDLNRGLDVAPVWHRGYFGLFGNQRINQNMRFFK